MRSLPTRVIVAALLAVGLVAVPGCGGSSSPPRPRAATLVLDFTPNAVHAGIYAALARHYDLQSGVRLHVVAPTASTDSIRLLETGRAQFAILDIHDLALARERGHDLVGIMAIVQRPLAAVIAQPQIRSPVELEGRLVGVTGLPSDTAVLDSIVAGAGGRPARVRTITIGFNAVPDLLAGRVAAATAFWSDEGVAVRRARPGARIFRVDSYGAPRYPELVLCATRGLLRHEPGLARATVRSVRLGYLFTEQHPGAAAADLEQRVPALDPGVVRRDLAGLEPAFRGRLGVAALDLNVLRRWARWESRFRIVERPPEIARMFDLSLLGAPRVAG